MMHPSRPLLLPAPDEVLRCAEHARAIAVDPGGTAIHAEVVMLVVVPLPWPKPALDHPILAEVAAAVAAGPVPVRLLAETPQDAPGDGGVDGDHRPVTVYHRQGGSAVADHYQLDQGSLVELGRALAEGHQPALTPVETHHPARPAVAICVQGSHDRCCGSEGMRLALDLDDTPDLDLIVHRVSHTGGHRFAPTAITWPDGRMWAGLDVELVQGVLARQVDPATAAAHCRGWWGAEPGPAQMAERAVFAHRGWPLNDQPRTVTVASDPAPGHPIPCTVSTTDEVWLVEVAEGRQVPTIACGQPGGLPVKAGQEYEVLSVNRR